MSELETTESNAPKVFISYSHEPEEYKTKVFDLANRLRAEYIDCMIDEYELNPEDGWFLWMYKQIKNADFVLVVCSERYKKSFEKEEDGGRGSAWEGCLINAEIFHEFSKNKKFIPIGFSKGDWNNIPFPFADTSRFLVSEEAEYQKIITLFSLKGKSSNIAPPLGSPRTEISKSSNIAPALGFPVKKQPEEPNESNKAKVFNVPFRQNPFFTGRETILESIERSFQTNNKQTVLTQAQTQAVHGLGGIGKTQIAVEFAYCHYKSYETILWIDAETNASLSKSVADIADRLDLPEKDSQEQEQVVKAVQRWLENNKNWLLILDNLEDKELHDNFLPKVCEGDVLITTRLDDIDTVNKLEVDKMGEEEGILFLLHRSGAIDQDQKTEDASSEDATTAKTIFKKFDGLPVALEQAGAYIKSNKSSLQKYLEMYEAEGTELNYAGVFKWSLKKTEEDCPEAGELIRLCAFLDPDSIPKFIFEEGKEFLSDGLSSILESRFKWEELISKACRYSLLKRNNDDQSLSMHRLVQQVIRGGLDDPKDWLEKAVKVLDSSFPDPEDLQNWPICAQLLPSIESFYKEVGGEKIEIIEVGILFDRVGSYFETRGIYKEAEPYYKVALKVLKTCDGEKYLNLVNSPLNNLANLYFRQGRYEDAEIIYKEVLNNLNILVGKEHPDIAACLNNLSNLYVVQERYAEAEPLLKDAHKMLKKLLGEKHPNIATSLNNLAELYRNLGCYEEAEKLFKESLNMIILLLGEDHPYIPSSFNNLAELYRHQGRYEEAEPLQKKALEMSKKLLGEEHPDVANSLNNLASLYHSQGRYEEAEPLYKDALIIRKKLLGDEHPHALVSLISLANIYYSQGRYEEAEPLYKDALIIRKKLLGEEHLDVANSLNNLANLYYSQGRYEEAEPLYKNALIIRKKLLGEEHLDVANSLNNLAALYDNQGRYEEAEPLYKNALIIRKKLLGEEHPDVASSLNNLAGHYRKQGGYEDAEPLYKDALEIWKKFLGDEHPNIGMSYWHLGVLRKDQKKLGEAEEYLVKAFNLFEKVLGGIHPWSAKCGEHLEAVRKQIGEEEG